MKKSLYILTCIFVSTSLFAQNSKGVITTGVPFLTIGADARANGMAGMGVATSADINSQQHNSSKYAFIDKQQEVAFSYVPYMSSISSGMGLAQLNYYYKYDERSAFAGSLRYFGMGEITMRENFDSYPATRKPTEFAIDFSYALQLSDKFAMGVAGRLINSDLKFPEQDDESSSATTFAVDINGYYQSNIFLISTMDAIFTAGFNFQNIGPKIKYGDERDGSFLPSNFKLGAGVKLFVDDKSTVSVFAEGNKLMVPTPYQGPDPYENAKRYNDIGWFKGMMRSFTDAPGGFSEEMKEIGWSIGSEYIYDNKFKFRLGQHIESNDKGGLSYTTMGAGMFYKNFNLDFAYLLANGGSNNPLKNSMSFTLSYKLR